jgi:hypothetical protein
MGRLWHNLVVAGLCIGGLAALQLPRLAAHTTASSVDPEVETAAQDLLVAQLDLLASAPSLGFDNLVADWTFLSFLQYFGNSEVRSETGYRAAPKFFDVIVGRDPYFQLFYLYLSGTVSLFAGQPEATVEILEKGLDSLSPQFPPDSYSIWRYKAIDELLFLGDLEAARASFLTAADWAEQSPLPGSNDSARRSRNTAEFLRQNPDSSEAQVNAWLQVWNNAVNDDVRQSVQAEIRELGYDLVFEGDRVQVVPLGDASGQDSPPESPPSETPNNSQPE